MTDEAVIMTSSIDIEKMVLGSLINHEKNASIGLKLVNDHDFFDPKHRVIFRTIQHVFNEKQVVEVSLISNKLKANNNLEYVGGLPYLITLAQYAGTSAHIEAYCDDLKKLTAKRQLFSHIQSMVTDLEQGINPFKIIEKCKTSLSDIEKNKAHAESAFRYLLEHNSEKALIEEIKTISEGVNTGFKIGEIDLVIPGGAITIVAAPTSHGKTSALINFSLGVINHHHDKNVYFFSYEENASSILCLFMNCYIGEEFSKDNFKSIKSHFFKANVEHIKTDMRDQFLNDKKEFFDHLIDKGRLKVFYSDMSTEELIQAIHFIKKNDPKVGMVCIDYMQFLKLLKRTQGSRQEELKEICLMMKDCAIDTGLPIMIAAQFNRQVVAEADLSPTQIGEAGDIERASNTIIGMWNRNFEGFSREGNLTKNKQKIPKEPAIYFEILKGRCTEGGAGHSCVMDFNGNTRKLENRPTKPNSKLFG